MSQSLLQRQVYSNGSFNARSDTMLRIVSIPSTASGLFQQCTCGVGRCAGQTSLNPFYSVRSIPTENLQCDRTGSGRSQSLLQRQVYSNLMDQCAEMEKSGLSQSLLQRQVYSNIGYSRSTTDTQKSLNPFYSVRSIPTNITVAVAPALGEVSIPSTASGLFQLNIKSKGSEK